MRYSTLKGINKQWSLITLGCWQLAPSHGWGDICSEKDAEIAVKTALDTGITAFDTAEGYGDGESERRLGKALGSSKEDVIIVSKVWPDVEMSQSVFMSRLDTTLKNLDRDYVDVYLLHFPNEVTTTSEGASRFIDIMKALKDSGKAATIGISNFKKPDLEVLGKDLKEFSVNQVPYSLLQTDYSNTSELCEHAGVKFMAYSPTCKGLLARKMGNDELDFPARDGSYYSPNNYPHALEVFNVLESIAKEIGCKPVHVALAWVLKQRNIHTAIMGSRKRSQIQDYSLASELELSKDHLQLLGQVSKEYSKLTNA